MSNCLSVDIDITNDLVTKGQCVMKTLQSLNIISITRQVQLMIRELKFYQATIKKIKIIPKYAYLFDTDAPHNPYSAP